MKRLLLPAALLAMSSLSAATLYWDGTDTTADADGGSGTWDTATANWDGAATAGANAVFVSGTDNAIFGGTAGTVTLGGAVNAGTVTFNAAGYVIDTNGFDATWATLAAGANGFTKAGTGTLTLTGGGTGTGLVTIGGGTIKIGAFNAVAGAVTVNVGGVYDFNGKAGTLANTLTLNGGKIDSSLNASIVGLDAGKILLAADSEIKGTSARSFHFKYTGGTLDLNGKTLTQSARIWVEGATTIANGTYLLNNQLDTYGSRTTWGDTSSLSIGTGGSININGADAALKNVSATAGSITLNGTGTSITQTTAGARTIAATISGGNALTFAGVSGAVTTLSGNNTYSGGTTITGGTIKLGHAAGLGTGAVTVGAGTILDFAGFAAANAFTLAGGELQNSSSASELDIPAGAKLALTANSTLGSTSSWWKYNGTYNLGGFTLTQTGQSWTPGTTTISNGTIQLNARWDGYGRVTWASDSALSIGMGGTYNVGGATTLYNVSGTAGSLNLGGATTINQTGTRTLASAIGGGANAVTFAGTGTTTLTGTNDYSGGTSITGGTIVTGNSAALGTGAVTLGGGTLQIGATNLSGIASLTVNTGTLNTAGGTVTTTGAFALAGGTWVIGDTADAIMAGSFTLTGGVIDLTGFTNKSTAGTYSLISGTGTSSFTNANFTNGDAGFSYAIDGNGDLTVTAVPEPSTYGLLGAGALAAAAFVRRRRKAKVA